MKIFELFILKDEIKSNDWQRFFNVIKEYDKKLIFEIIFNLNIIEFYLYSDKDLSLLATKIEDFF